MLLYQFDWDSVWVYFYALLKSKSVFILVIHFPTSVIQMLLLGLLFVYQNTSIILSGCGQLISYFTAMCVVIDCCD